MPNKSFQQLAAMPFPPELPPHTASCTSSATLPENQQKAVGILSSHEFHRQAGTGSLLHFTNWLDFPQSRSFSDEGWRLLMHRTPLSKEPAGHWLQGREQLQKDQGVVCLLEKCMWMLDRARVCKTSCYKQIQNKVIPTSRHPHGCPGTSGR